MVTNHNGAVGLIVSPIHPPAPAGPTPNLAVVGNVARTGGLFTPAYLQVTADGTLEQHTSHPTGALVLSLTHMVP